MKVRDRRITIRLTNAEREHLQTQADRAGLGVEPFVRSLIMGAEIRPRPPDELPELIRQLAAIGNNINQLTRIANRSKYVRREDIQRLDELLGQAWEKVKSI